MEALRENNKALLEEGICSDMTFVFKEERIEAHKYILSVASPVFRSMFNGNFVEAKKDEINILDITPSTFKTLLKFIYIHEYPKLDEENWAPLLYASEKYQITSLQNKCKEFANKNHTKLDACRLFNQARKNEVDSLVPSVKRTIVLNADKYLTLDSLFEIEDSESLHKLLSSDKLDLDEIDVFRSVLKWASSRTKNEKEEENGVNLRKVLGQAIYSIRFQTMSPNELVNEVIPKDILTDEEITCILKKKKESNPFNCEPRIRSCDRFNSCVSPAILSKRHSIEVQVDCQIKIHGFGIYNLCHDEQDSVKGRMFLKDEENSILGKESFKVDFEREFPIDVHDFPKPIIIHPNTLYTLITEYDSLNVKVYSGKGGKPEFTHHGVKWTFKNDPLSCEETNIHQGQIPKLYFSKMD